MSWMKMVICKVHSYYNITYKFILRCKVHKCTLQHVTAEIRKAITLKKSEAKCVKGKTRLLSFLKYITVQFRATMEIYGEFAQSCCLLQKRASYKKYVSQSFTTIKGHHGGHNYVNNCMVGNG